MSDFLSKLIISQQKQTEKQNRCNRKSRQLVDEGDEEVKLRWVTDQEMAPPLLPGGGASGWAEPGKVSCCFSPEASLC